MRCGKLYMDFNSIKKAFNLPDDALLKYIKANNEHNEIEITFYSNCEKYDENTTSQNIERRCI